MQRVMCEFSEILSDSAREREIDALDLRTKELHAVIATAKRVETELRWDIEAYRGALGYEISGSHTGKLSDGTTPQCGMCNSEYRNGLETMSEVLKWASKNVWTMMRPDSGTQNQWFVMLNDSSHFYALTLYEVLYEAWKSRND